MSLREIIEKYLAVAGTFGHSASLAEFGLGKEEIERAFDAFDEDYHISRYFHFARLNGPAFNINGFDQTHITIDAEIESVL